MKPSSCGALSKRARKTALLRLLLHAKENGDVVEAKSKEVPVFWIDHATDRCQA